MMERQVGRRWPLGSPHTALPLGRSGKRTPAATKREMRERVGLPNGQHLSCPKPVHATGANRVRGSACGAMRSSASLAPGASVAGAEIAHGGELAAAASCSFPAAEL